jgi:hypothetical protein
VLPLRYELKFYMPIRINSVRKGLRNTGTYCNMEHSDLHYLKTNFDRSEGRRALTGTLCFRYVLERQSLRTQQWGWRREATAWGKQSCGGGCKERQVLHR